MTYSNMKLLLCILYNTEFKEWAAVALIHSHKSQYITLKLLILHIHIQYKWLAIHAVIFPTCPNVP